MSIDLLLEALKMFIEAQLVRADAKHTLVGVMEQTVPCVSIIIACPDPQDPSMGFD